MPIDFMGFKWITIKEPSTFLYAQRHVSCGMFQSGYLNRGIWRDKGSGVCDSVRCVLSG